MLSTPTCKRVLLRYRRVNMEALPVAMVPDRQYSLSLYTLCDLFYTIMDVWCGIGKKHKDLLFFAARFTTRTSKYRRQE